MKDEVDSCPAKRQFNFWLSPIFGGCPLTFILTEDEHQSTEYIGVSPPWMIQQTKLENWIRYCDLGTHTMRLTNNWLREFRGRATKLIHGLHDQPYVDRLARLHLPSLQYRRLRGDFILLYRMYHNDLGINFTDYFTTPHVTFTRGYSCKLLSHMLSAEQEPISFQLE